MIERSCLYGKSCILRLYLTHMSSMLAAYRLADGGIIAFVDGNIHLCVPKDSSSFPVFQWRPDHSTTPRHFSRGGRGGGGRTELSCRRENKHVSKQSCYPWIFPRSAVIATLIFFCIFSLALTCLQRFLPVLLRSAVVCRILRRRLSHDASPCTLLFCFPA